MERIQQFLEQPLQIFGDNPWLRAAVAVIVAILLAKLADWIITKLFLVWARKSKTKFDDRLIELAHRPIFLSVLLIGLWLATTQIEPGHQLRTFTTRVLLTIGLLTWVGFAFRACTMFLEILSSFKGKFKIVQPRTVSLFDQVTKIVLTGGSIYLLFLTWGVDVRAILAAGGIIGIAVGFAAKDSLANLFSGIFILADAPYHVGDFIVLDSGERGSVSHIGLRSTRLLTRDDIEVTVPNAVIANAKILNESGGPREKARIRVKVGVAYGSDIDLVRSILMKVAEENHEIDHDPAPRVRFRAFGDSSLNFELLGWVHPILRGRVLDDLHSEVYRRFAAENIVIPFPQRDVHVFTHPSED